MAKQMYEAMTFKPSETEPPQAGCRTGAERPAGHGGAAGRHLESVRGRAVPATR